MDSFAVTVANCRLLTVPEIKNEIEGYDVSFVDRKGNDKDERMLLVEVHVKNIGEASDVFYVSSCILQSGAYSQSMTEKYFGHFNTHLKTPDPAFLLKPGEAVTVYIPYTIYQISFLDDAWSKIDSRAFELVFSMYPVSRIVTL